MAKHQQRISIFRFVAVLIVSLLGVGFAFMSQRQPASWILGETNQRYIDILFDNVKVTRNIQYGQAPAYKSNRIEKLLLDIYEPVGDTEHKRAAIIWIHGGSFVAGSKDQFADGEVRGFASDYASRGYVSIPIDYRLADHAVTLNDPTAPSIIQMAKSDALAAVRWVRSHADSYHIDPNRIIVGGFSAGAFTALYAAYDTTTADPSVAASISFSGGMLPSALTVINAGDPPAILIHGEKDAIVPLSLASSVANRLTELGIPNKLIPYPGGHGTTNIADAHENVRRFLAATLQLTATAGPTASASPTVTPTPTTPSPTQPAGSSRQNTSAQARNMRLVKQLKEQFFPDLDLEEATVALEQGPRRLLRYIVAQRKYSWNQILGAIQWWRHVTQ